MGEDILRYGATFVGHWSLVIGHLFDQPTVADQLMVKSHLEFNFYALILGMGSQ